MVAVRDEILSINSGALKVAHQVDILLRQVRASIEGAVILEKLRPLCFCQGCHFVTRMKIRRRRSLRMRREAQAQPASRRVQRVFELDAGKLDFVTITPRQDRWLIGKMAVPPQRRLQGDASLLRQ